MRAFDKRMNIIWLSIILHNRNKCFSLKSIWIVIGGPRFSCVDVSRCLWVMGRPQFQFHRLTRNSMIVFERVTRWKISKCNESNAAMSRQKWLRNGTQNQQTTRVGTARAEWTLAASCNSSIFYLLIRFIWCHGIWGRAEHLPAGWLAVGPSRFHVIFGFGEPFPSQADRHRRDESELKWSARGAAREM